MTSEATATAYTNEALFRKNVEVLSRHAPRLRDLLDSDRQSYTVAETQDGFQLNDRAGNPVLPEPEPAYSRKRMEEFLAEPFVLRHDRHPSHVPDRSLWRDRITPILQELPRDMWFRPVPLEGAHTLACLDAPAKDVLLEAIEKFTSLKNTYIFIYDLGLFLQNLHFTDWSDAILFFEKRRVNLDFVYIGGESNTAEYIATFLWSKNMLLANNIPVYFHVNSPQSYEIKRALQTKYTNRLIGVGFFSDEMEMIRATRENILERRRHVISSKEQHDGTAIIVASGPSLDESLDVLRSVAKQGFVIAAGTAVEALLSAGIKVDCCVVLERGPEVPTVFRDMVTRVDLSEVPMVASSTVDPETEDYFARGLYFFRPGLNVSEGFDQEHEHTILYCDPTVANTAVALALYTGFRKLVLFGVDFGAPDPERHHTKNTAYYTSDAIDDIMEADPIVMDETAIAVFGGLVQSNVVLNWSRLRMEACVSARPDALVVSVSTGAQIKGVIPLMPASAAWLPTVFPLLHDPYPEDVLTPNEYDISKYNYDLKHLEEYCSLLEQWLKELSWENRHDVAQQLNRLLFVVRRTDPFRTILRGAVTEMIWSFLSMTSRMTEEERARYEATLREKAVEALQSMKEEVANLVRVETQDMDGESAETP